MKTFFSTAILGLILVSGFIYLMDPGYRWKDAPAPFTRNLKSNEVRISPVNFDERTVKVSQMKYIDTPDILLLGSSRVRIVSSEFFAPRLEVFNGGMSTSSFEDFLALWQGFKSFNKIPKKIIIFVDPWQFNSSANQELTGWKNIRGFVEEFYKEKKLTLNSESTQVLKKDNHKKTISERVAKIKTKLESHLKLVPEVLSWPMLHESLNIFLKKGITSERSSNRIVELEDIRPEDSGIRRDGSFIYPAVEMKPKTSEILENMVTRYVTESNYLFDNWSFDNEAGPKLRLLVEDMLSKGAQVLVILPPFHSKLVPKMSAKVGYGNIFKEASLGFSKALSGLDVSFCDREDPTMIQCKDTEMMDTIHMLKPCVTKLLESCLTGSRWGSTLQKSSLVGQVRSQDLSF